MRCEDGSCLPDRLLDERQYFRFQKRPRVHRRNAASRGHRIGQRSRRPDDLPLEAHHPFQPEQTPDVGPTRESHQGRTLHFRQHKRRPCVEDDEGDHVYHRLGGSTGGCECRDAHNGWGVEPGCGADDPRSGGQSPEGHTHIRRWDWSDGDAGAGADGIAAWKGKPLPRQVVR